MSILLDKINIALFVTAGLNFLLGLIVFFNGRRKKINIIYSLNIIAIILWVVMMIFYRSAPPATDIFWCTALYIAPTLIASSFLYFTYIFPTQPDKKIGVKILGIFVTNALIALLVASPGLIIQSVIPRPGLEKIIIFTPVYWLYFIYTLAFFSYGFIRLYRRYAHSAGIEQQQILYLLTGYAIAANLAFVTNLVMPWLGATSLNWLGQVFTVIMVGFTSYAIVRHRLMDIRTVAQKGIIYTILLALITGVYLGLLFIFLFFNRTASSTVFLASAILTTVIGIFTVPRIKNFFNKITDRIFFKDKYDYSLAVKELSEILNRHLELNDILDKTTQKLSEILKVKYIYVYLAEHRTIFANIRDRERGFTGKECALPFLDEFLKTDEVLTVGEVEYLLARESLPEATKKFYQEFKRCHWELGWSGLFTLKTEEKNIGALIVGDKLSGYDLTDEDTRLLQTFAEQATLAIEKAQLFAQVKDYSANLEKRVHARTAEIKEIHENQEQLILDISHKLETPLAVLKSEVTKLAAESPKDASWRAFGYTIDRVAKFISDMLKIAKMDFASNEARKEKFSLSDLMEDLVEYFNVSARDHGIKIIDQIKSRVQFYGVKENIEELLSNLVSNAIKYNSNKKLVTIKLHDTDENIYIEVEDTGVGIPKEELPYLFKRFYQPSRQYEGDQTGTGLGMAICEKIVKNHRGKINVASEVGRGTKVTVIFPKNLEKK